MNPPPCIHPRPNPRSFFMARVPQYPHDRGYAANREQAMADFRAASGARAVILKKGDNSFTAIFLV